MISEERLAEILRYDFSQGTERFRDELLARCLSVLGEDEEADGTDEADDMADGTDDTDEGDGRPAPLRPAFSLVEEPAVRELDDEELLAVAGGIGDAGDETGSEADGTNPLRPDIRPPFGS